MQIQHVGTGCAAFVKANCGVFQSDLVLGEALNFSGILNVCFAPGGLWASPLGSVLFGVSWQSVSSGDRLKCEITTMIILPQRKAAHFLARGYACGYTRTNINSPCESQRHGVSSPPVASECVWVTERCRAVKCRCSSSVRRRCDSWRCQMNVVLCG